MTLNGCSSDRPFGAGPPSCSGCLGKLLILDAAEALSDLRVPPGNRLERLTGDRAAQYGIRINDRWRICFEWRNRDAHAVEIVDYH